MLMSHLYGRESGKELGKLEVWKCGKWEMEKCQVNLNCGRFEKCDIGSMENLKKREG